MAGTTNGSPPKVRISFAISVARRDSSERILNPSKLAGAIIKLPLSPYRGWLQLPPGEISV
jgi:hypothetical protein